VNNRVGQQIGNYRIIRLLGTGGFAEVYLGQHVHLNTLAAIKLLQALLTTQESERFRTEAQIIAGLTHPHIVRVLDFGIEDRAPFLVMDYAPNGTIRHRYPLGSRLPLSLILDYVNQITGALQYAHNQKLVHRDVKPENLLIGRSQELLLSDFGTALTMQATMTQSVQEVAGTVAYMAPELFSGYPRPASDQYALAIIVYEWISGMRPFEGSTFTEMAFKQSMVPPPPLRNKVPDLPPSIEQVIMTALAKDPVQRYPHISDFAAALTQASQTSSGIQYSSSSQHNAAYDRTLTPEMNAPTQRVGEHSQSTILTDKQKKGKQAVSRRVVVTSALALTGIAGVGGGLAWYLTSQMGTTSIQQAAGTTVLEYTKHTLPVYTLAWSPDQKLIASGGQDKTIRVWDPTNGQDHLIYDQQGASENSVAWSPSSRFIASASSSRTVDVWDAKTGRQTTSYTEHTDVLRTVAWSPNGALIASGGDDKTVQVWEALTGNKKATYAEHTDQVWSLAWSPDGNSIASASADKTVRIWDVATQQTIHIYQEHKHQVKAIAWSHNGRFIASASDDLTVRVWRVPTLETISIYRKHRDDLNAIAWSFDDKYVASGSGDYTIHIFDAMTGQMVLEYTDHTLAVHSLAWSKDGQFIASASDDKTVRIWRAKQP
jgi:WD40 repeat protein